MTDWSETERNYAMGVNVDKSKLMTETAANRGKLDTVPIQILTKFNDTAVQLMPMTSTAPRKLQ